VGESTGKAILKKKGINKGEAVRGRQIGRKPRAKKMPEKRKPKLKELIIAENFLARRKSREAIPSRLWRSCLNGGGGRGTDIDTARGD